VDAVVLGEGEETMAELVKTWSAGGDPQTVPGLALPGSDGPRKTAPRELVASLDDLPVPDRREFKLADYANTVFMKDLCGAVGLPARGYADRVGTMIASRGCVGNCRFCSTHKIWGHRYRLRNPLAVVDEMEMLHREHGCRLIAFVDDIFSVDRGQVIALSRELARRRLDLVWAFETSVHHVDEEMLTEARRSGCVFIAFGVESGSARILKQLGKKDDVEAIERAFATCRQTGIKAGAFMMVGYPGEDDETVEETLRLVERIRPALLVTQIPMLFPGSELYQLAVDQGLIDDSYWLSQRPAPYYTGERELAQLVAWQRRVGALTARRAGRWARRVRDALEDRTGVRVTRQGLVRVRRRER
jgi:anaerobic magnesium-protoporphyrin IX monomethyl ester cyclase